MTSSSGPRAFLPDGVAGAPLTGPSAPASGWTSQGALALAAGWLDDAALFPPGELPLPQAVPAHLAHRQAWYGDFVGPFVVGVAHLARLAAHLPTERIAVSLVGSAESVLAVELPPGVTLASVEVSPPAAPDAASVLAAAVSVRRAVAPQRPVFVEVPWSCDPRAVAGGLAEIGAAVKLRTGGIVATAFPSAPALADAISACVSAGVPFKATAGLHRAVAHTAAGTGFDHHGFLNLLLVAAAAPEGDPVAVLQERDEAVVLDLLRGVDVAAARQRFVSFGTCSVTEPVEDLLRLGLVAAPVAG